MSSCANQCSLTNLSYRAAKTSVYAAIEGAMMYGAARIFTSINPIGAAVAGVGLSIGQTVLKGSVPNPSYLKSDNILATAAIKTARSAAITLSSYALATFVANATGYPITFTATVLLSFAAEGLLYTLLGLSLVTATTAGSIFCAKMAYNAVTERHNLFNSLRELTK
jgi:hypothetical protein